MINNTLIAIMNNKADFERARHEGWYRIPVETKSVPLIVRRNKVQFIAFYHTDVFEDEKFSIRHFAYVNKITVVKRKTLLPPPAHPLERVLYDRKADKDYYKIEFSALHQLSCPIISKKHRRILFIPTTAQKLFNAPEINYLFNDSALEETLWHKLVALDIPSERQYFQTLYGKNVFLDFAIFCRDRNIDIECDGDRYHTARKSVYADKQRNNLLESNGWSVLRFTPKDIYTDLNDTLDCVAEAINKAGGVGDDEKGFRYVAGGNEPDFILFEPESPTLLKRHHKPEQG